MCMIIFVKSEDEYGQYVSSWNAVEHQICYKLILQYGSIDAYSRNKMTICSILLTSKSKVSVKDIAQFYLILNMIHPMPYLYVNHLVKSSCLF